MVPFRAMETYIRFVIRHRVAVLAFLAVLTGAAGWALSQGVMATSLGTLFLGESPEYLRYKDRVAEFGGDNLIIVGYEVPDLLGPDAIDGLARAMARIQAMDDVARVESLLDAAHIQGADGIVRITNYTRSARETPSRAGPLLDQLRADPLYRDLVVSADGSAGAVIVELPVDDSRPVEREPAIVAGILEILAEEGFPATQLHRTGVVSLVAEVMHQAIVNITRIFPATALILLVMVWLLFRRLWPALITSGVGAISVLWTMGFSVLLDRNINILVALVPAVMLIVSFSDVIHLCSAYLLECERCDDRDEAILRAGTDVGRACLYTSLTTFAGFVSLSLVPAPVFRMLGLVLGCGVAIALLLAMTLTPIFFSLMPKPRPWRGGRSLVMETLDRILGGVQGLALGRPRLVIAGFAIFLGVAVVGTLQIHIDTSFQARLAEDNEVTRDTRWFEERFAGSATLEVYIDAPEGRDLLDPEVLGAMAAYQDGLEDLPGVDRAASLVDIIRRVHHAMVPDAPPGEIPADRKRIADYMLLLEMSGEDIGLDRLVDFDRRTARVILRMEQGTPVRETHALGRAAEAQATTHLPVGTAVEATGAFFLMGGWLDQIIIGQRRGLGVAFLSILVMMVLALRSLRAGLWSMLPNILPLLALGGFAGFMWENTDSDTLAIAMIAIGIGVDDTIHFLMRLRLEMMSTSNLREALARTFHFSGRAIVITSVVLVAGFAPFLLSDYLTVSFFGNLLPMCLIVALLADLLLVPALATFGVFRFKKNPRT
ncbi:MAG: MMPL family transporter [Pseudomonadota bacterium]